MTQPTPSRLFFYTSRGKRVGPVSAQQLRTLAVSGALSPSDSIWEVGSDEEVPASRVKGLFPTVAWAEVQAEAEREEAASSSREARDDVAPPRKPSARDVFISYSSQDKPTADAICATLERDKVRCWIAPRDVLPGVHYGEAIIDGINSCRLLVVVLSSASNRSPQVLREVERAVSKGMPIVPFRIEDVVPSKSMEYFLSAPHWLDALTKPLEAHIERLSSVVRAVLDPDSHSRPGGQGLGTGGPGPKPPVRGFATVVGESLSAVSEKLSRIPRRGLQVGLGIALLAVLMTMVVMGMWPNPLEAEYTQYRDNVVTGRGSVVFLQRAAPLRYTKWRERAEAGDPIAELLVGRCYQEGLVVSQDHAAALPWLEKSAAQGNDFAMHTLGLAHELGQGVTPDRSEALRWYTQAADRGNTVSMRAIGGLYETGVTGKPDPTLALSWYRKAADAGDPVAMRFVGNCYLYGTGVTKDVAESERWFQRAEAAGDAFLVGKQFGNRLAPHFAEYLKVDASEPTKTGSLSALKGLMKDYEQLDFANVSALFSASEINTAITGIQDLKAEDPLRLLYDEMTQRYVTLYAAASRSERTSNLSNFSLATESLVNRWFSDRRYDEVVGFWEKSYKDIPLGELKTSGEFNALIRQLNWSISSLMRTGQRKEAQEVLRGALELCDWSLQERPWDWYMKDAYSGLCFDAAASWVELGEQAEAQPLLRRGWGVRMRQFGKEALLARYAELPLKGQVPEGATDADRDFFERFAPDAAQNKKGGMTRFTIPCDFAGRRYPFHVYVLEGPRGYTELLDQFRWVKDMRGGEVPGEVRSSFLRLNQIAVENKVNFRDLCVYALGTAAKESETEAKGDSPK